MVRYTLLRLLIFFGFLVLFWLIGLRDNKVLLLGAAALASAAASYILLRDMRDEMTSKLMDRHEAKLRARDVDPLADEQAEDREADADR
jgi:hypothetical protein